jgi:uncharacterized membrane protein
MNKHGKHTKKVFYAIIAIALIAIAYYAFNPKQNIQKDLSLSKSQVTTIQTPADTQSSNKNKSTPSNADEGIKIVKDEVSSKANFYPFKLDGVNMEIMAIKASDGTIRTALNTCQVCYDSGRGYYIQVGDYLVCQNCGNRFHIDQIEKIKGCCNPVPILEENKKDMGSYIVLSKEFIATQKQYFSNWKRS